MSIKTDLERTLNLKGKLTISSNNKKQLEVMYLLKKKYKLTEAIIGRDDGLGYFIEYTKVKNV
jgi:hypothetical protein